MHVCLYQVDQEGIVHQVLGTSGEKELHRARGSSVFELIPKSRQHHLREHLATAFKTTEPSSFRYGVGVPGGCERTYEVRILPSRLDVNTDHVMLAVLDVSDLASAVRQLKDRHEELISIFETLPDTYFRIGSNGTILDYHTQKAFDLYLPPELFLGRRIQEILPAHVNRLYEKNLKQLREGETDVAYEYELDLPTGRQIFESRLSALPRSDDIIAVIRNITARRRAENQLLETNRRLEEAQSIAHIGSWTFDVEARRVSWSLETYRIFGVEQADFIPTIDWVGQSIHPEDREKYNNQLELWLSGADTRPVDLRILRSDGTERVLNTRCRAVHDDCQKLTHLTGTVQDVTEQRSMEQALKSSEERILHMIEMSWDMILLLDAYARATYVNSAIERVLGYSPSEIIGKNSLDFVYPEDLKFARENLSKLLKDRANPVVLQLRLNHRDGGWRWLEVIARNLLDKPGLSSIVVNMRDITDRKQTEKKLQAQEQRFRVLIENSADALALLNQQGIVTYASSSNARVMGYTPADLEGLSLFDFIAPESCGRFKETFASTMGKPGVPVAVNTEALKINGMRTRLEGHLTNLLDLVGVKAVVFNYRDVTERERQREALEQAHREADMFRRMVNFATQAIGTADLNAQLLYQNPALLRLLGVPSMEVASQYSYEDFYLEEDLEYLRREVIPSVLSKGHWIGEMRLKPLDRGPVPTIHNVYLVCDDESNPVMFSNVVTDISQQKEIEQALRTSETKYRQLFEEALDGIAVADIETGELLDCNPALCRMVGRSREELIGQPQRILHPTEEIVGKVCRAFEVHRSVDPGKIVASQLISSTGQLMDVEIIANVIELEGRTAIQGVFRDVMEKKRAEEALFEEKERAQVTLHSIGDAVITTDDTCRVDYLNPVAEKLTGWSLKEAGGHLLDDIFQIHDENSDEKVDNLVARCIREGKVIDIARNIVLRGREGDKYDIDESAAPIRRADGRILGAVLVFHDVSETRRLTRQMAYDAAHDPLTGLINRREFEIRLAHALESAKKYGSRHALCYIDLDQFKIVNDTAGHEAGDVLLKQIRSLLHNTYRDHDTLARLGGDEFGLLLDNCPVERAVSISSAIINCIREYRFVWQGRGYQIGASVGVAPITRDTESITRLLSHADVACYTAKELGRNRVHLYHEREGVPVQRHVEILQAAGLRDALEMERFRLFCQPIVPLHGDDKETVRYELLLRLQDEEGGLVLPGAFIPAAERFDLMTDIDRWVIRAAFRSYDKIPALRKTRISVNLSGNSLNDESLLDYVREQFNEFALSPEKVCFEITETAAVTDLSRAGRFINELQKLGCQLALDDFGSGLSSLRYLKALPVDFLKIDGSFIKDLDTDSGNQAIVAAVNQLAHQLGIRTIGEYAASRSIVKTLRSLGVDYAQGYALGPPVPLSNTEIINLSELN